MSIPVDSNVHIKIVNLNGVVDSIRIGNDGKETYLVKYQNALGKYKYIRCNEHGLTII